MLVPLATVMILCSLTPLTFATELTYGSPDSLSNDCECNKRNIHYGPFVQLANKTWLEIKKGNLPDSELLAMQQFQTRCLGILFGKMSKIYLASSLRNLSALFSEIEHILIEPYGIDYQIELLTCTLCNLKAIPENLHRLRRLRVLNLNANNIQYIEMNQFNSLKQLESLNFAANGIKTVKSESLISLPVLREIDFRENNIMSMDICSWNMPALEKLELSTYDSPYLLDSIQHLPKLKIFGTLNQKRICEQGKMFLLKSAQLGNITLEYLKNMECDDNYDEDLIDTSCSPLPLSLVEFDRQLNEQQRNLNNVTNI